ncbi:LOG family protein [Roseibaca sp. Y0-43]|uniref:LOG family protein n=1 Tax=Roseibaca sp. Y0-43 TaxID=2816854 RepID=UPI001D0C9DEA|nr:LOG family protein [Roseibaca sp. Y0-43]
MKDRDMRHPFPDARQDMDLWDGVPDTPQTRHPAYRLAFADPDFLVRDELRPVRLQLELLKPELLMAERGIQSTIVMFGGARIPRPEDAAKARTPVLADLSRFYEEARKFAYEMTLRSVQAYGREDVIITGGGPGVMEAGNLGAEQAGGVSIGLNIVLPHEQAPNPYVTPDLTFNFHYFAIRKMHFLMRAKAITVFPGGFGTLDETFEALTLIQTKRMAKLPFILFGRDFWSKVVNWDMLAEAGTISPEDLNLFHMVDTAEEAIAVIDGFSAD